MNSFAEFAKETESKFISDRTIPHLAAWMVEEQVWGDKNEERRQKIGCGGKAGPIAPLSQRHLFFGQMFHHYYN